MRKVNEIRKFNDLGVRLKRLFSGVSTLHRKMRKRNIEEGRNMCGRKPVKRMDR